MLYFFKLCNSGNQPNLAKRWAILYKLYFFRMPLLSTKFATLTINVLKLVQNLFSCTKHAKTLSTLHFKSFFWNKLGKSCTQMVGPFSKITFLTRTNGLVYQPTFFLEKWSSILKKWNSILKFQKSDIQKTGHLKWKWKLRNLDCVLVKKDFTIINFLWFFLASKAQNCYNSKVLLNW